MLMLGEMRVDVDGVDDGGSDEHSTTTRLFRRKLLETDELDEVRAFCAECCPSHPSVARSSFHKQTHSLTRL